MSQHIVSLYDDHEKAAAAVQLLKDAGFNEKHISLLGHADVGDAQQLKDAGIAARGVGIGALVGVLAGVGVAVIPGVGLLYGLGAVAAGIAGLDAGIIGGTIISALAIKSMGKEVAERYEGALKAGNTLLAFSGSQEEVAQARVVLESHGHHTELNAH